MIVWTGARPLPRRAAPRRAVGLSAAGAFSLRARAGSDWPTQPVRYTNLFPPGGATDILSRLFCAKVSELPGQQFVVENRAGAAGTVG